MDDMDGMEDMIVQIPVHVLLSIVTIESVSSIRSVRSAV